MATNTLSAYPKIGLPQIVVFNLLILVWWLEVGLRVSFFSTIRLEFLLAATATAMAIMQRQAVNRTRMQGRRMKVEDNSDITTVIIIFVVVFALSVPLAINIERAWHFFFNRLAKLALIGALISQFVVSPATLRFYLFTLLVAFMKVGQEAFLGQITGNMVWENQGVPRLHGTAGTMFGDPNSLSGKTVSTVPWIWYLFPTIQRNWIKLLVALQLVFAINIIVFTASRTGYVTFIVVALFILMLTKHKRGRLIMLLIVASIATVTFMPPEYKERFMSSFTGQEAEGASSATRKALLTDSANAFLDNPLGVGLGCFRLYQAQHGRNAQETHNLYTQLLAEAGIQGFLCFAALLFVILRKAFRCRRAMEQVVDKLERYRAATSAHSASDLEEELKDARLLLATTNALIVFTLVRLVLGVFGHDLLELYWWLAAGTVMALHNMRLVAERRCAELLASGGSAATVPAQSRSPRPYGQPRAETRKV